jgi:hypothetical protein
MNLKDRCRGTDGKKQRDIGLSKLGPFLFKKRNFKLYNFSYQIKIGVIC